jgi:hypothetical protein
LLFSEAALKVLWGNTQLFVPVLHSPQRAFRAGSFSCAGWVLTTPNTQLLLQAEFFGFLPRALAGATTGSTEFAVGISLVAAAALPGHATFFLVLLRCRYSVG